MRGNPQARFWSRGGGSDPLADCNKGLDDQAHQGRHALHTEKPVRDGRTDRPEQAVDGDHLGSDDRQKQWERPYSHTQEEKPAAPSARKWLLQLKAFSWTFQRGSSCAPESRTLGAVIHHGYGQPTPGAGARVVRIWPVRAPLAMLAVPCHSVATRNNVLLSAPPRAHAKHPRSR